MQFFSIQNYFLSFSIKTNRVHCTEFSAPNRDIEPPKPTPISSKPRRRRETKNRKVCTSTNMRNAKEREREKEKTTALFVFGSVVACTRW